MQRAGPLEAALVRKERAASPARRDLRDLRQVSLWSILRHDNASFLLASFGTVLFAYSLLVCVTGRTIGGRGRPSRPVAPGEAQAFALVTGGLMAVLCALAGLRAWRVHRLFRVGEVVQATVEAVSHAKGRSRVSLDYEFGGTRRSIRRSIRKSSRALALQPEDALALLADPHRPKRVVLAELYD